MQEARLAKIYAKSLLDLSIEQQQLEEVLKDMNLISKTTKVSRELVLMLKSPLIKGDKKGQILKAVFEGKVNELTQSFTHLLSVKGRANYLPEMAQAFIQLYKVHNNIKEVFITSAKPLSEEIINAIKAKVSSQMNDCTLEVNETIDPTLLGGYVLEIEDKLFDASVKTRLNNIKQQFLQNEYVAKI